MRYDIVCAGSTEGISATAGSVLQLNFDKSLLTFTAAGPQQPDLACLEKEGISHRYKKTDRHFSARANLGRAEGEGDYILFIRAGSCLHPDALNELEGYIAKKGGEAAAFRLGSLPYTETFHSDPVTLETGRVNKNRFVIKREVFESIGGFDENLLHSLEDTDLSARLRRAGKGIVYAPAALVFSDKDPAQQSFEEYIYSVHNKLLLAYKYLDREGVKAARKEYTAAIKNPRPYPGVRKTLLKMYAGASFARGKMKKYRGQNRTVYSKAGDILLTLPGPVRGVAKVPYISGGAENFTLPDYLPSVKAERLPLVSVVVRTHSRPSVLEQTLKSLENQTYKNFQVVIAEDGEPTARQMIKDKFSHLDTDYFATGRHVGRGKAGNMGIERSAGEYICLLDDDDFYYPEFIYAHLATILSTGADMAISGVMAAKTRVIHKEPYEFVREELYPVNFSHITIMDMCVKCRVPSCAGMFKKELFEKYGGMREDIGGDEDWAMWLKYMAWGNRHDHFGPDIPAAMSLVAEPADSRAARRRLADYRQYDKRMLFDPRLVFTLSGREIEQCEKYVRADFLHLKYNGLLDDFIAGLRPLGSRWMEYDKNGENKVSAAQLNSYYYRLIAGYLTEG